MFLWRPLRAGCAYCRTVSDLLRLEPAGPGRFRVRNEGDPAVHDVVFGGQLMGQTIVAASASCPGKRVRTLHTIFARAARVSAATELAVEALHDGRRFASTEVTVWQDERLCARSLVLLDAGDPDLLRHGAEPPDVPGPDQAAPREAGGLLFPGSELRVVGDVDLSDPDAPTGPAELQLWTRCPDADDDPATSQAVLAWGTDGFLIATAMRPHAGVGQAQAHRTLATGVISHTLSFHEPVDAREWLLLAHESSYAGGGRCYGRAQAFTREGRLVASYVQDAMIRAS